MRCADVRPELEAYVDGELDQGRAALLKRHIAGCEGCRAELSRLRALVAALETWPLADEPAWLTARAMARLRSRPARPRFQIHWSDLMVSLAGAGATFVTALAWRYFAASDPVRLHQVQMYLWLETPRLVQRVTWTGVLGWGLALIGGTLLAVLAFLLWDSTVGKQSALL
jgi:anti-sigma factor RsiW